jgi:hypothetical protein
MSPEPRIKLVEVDLPNTNFAFCPGMYAQFTTTMAIRRDRDDGP